MAFSSSYLLLNDSLSYLYSNVSNNTLFETSMICATSLFQCIFLSICLGLLIICTMIGNSFVIAAIILERNLQMSVANYLIASLASADLTVSLMVMPIAAYIEISDKWHLGSLVCDIWTSFDVLCCTASILHLVAIALDRYWAITNVEYAAKRTVQRIVKMIVIIWTISTIVGVSPHIFGLSSSKSNQVGVCRLTDNLTFQLVSTFAAFYLPLVFMCVIYWKIFQSAKFRIRKKVFNNNNQNKKNQNKSNLNSFNRLKSLTNLKFNDLNRTESLVKDTLVTSTNFSNTDLHKQNGQLHENNCDSNDSKCCCNNMFKMFRNKTNLTDPNSLEMKDANNTKAFNTTSFDSSGSSFNERTISVANLKDNPTNIQIMPHENLIANYASNTNKVTASVISLKDINNNNIDETSSNKRNSKKINKTKTRSFNAKKLEQIQRILKKADSVNRNLEKLQNNEIQIDDIELLFKNTISDYNLRTELKDELKNEDDLNNKQTQNENNPQVSEAIPSSPPPSNLENKFTDSLKVKEPIPNNSHAIVSYQNSYEGMPKQTGEILTNNISNIKSSNVHTLLKKKAKIDIKRERKAARVLGIIMSCFIVCWLPYFCMQLFIAVCKDCSFSILLEQYRIGTILTWSSYLNSLLNPIIYTIFSPDFREAFAKILFGKYSKQRTFKARR